MKKSALLSAYFPIKMWIDKKRLPSKMMIEETKIKAAEIIKSNVT